MQKFNLTIFRQTRVLIGLFLTPCFLIGLLFLSIELHSVFLGLLLIILYLLTIFYFVIGHLTIIIENDQLNFTWTKKFIFNYKNIEPVKLADIKTIVIDNGEFLRKIKTNSRTIPIYTTKFQQKDIFKFINQLKEVTKDNSLRTIDSWDEWADKGFIKIAYRINIAILILATVVVTTFIFLKGFNSRHLFIFLLFIPQLYLYGQQMKQKIKNDNK